MSSLYKNQNKIILLTKMIRTFTRWRYQKNTFNKFLYFMGGMVFALGIVILAQYEDPLTRIMTPGFLLFCLGLLVMGYRVLNHNLSSFTIDDTQIPYMVSSRKGVPLFVHASFLKFFPKANNCSLPELMKDYFLKEPFSLEEGRENEILDFVVYHENDQKIHCVLRRFSLKNGEKWLWLIDKSSTKYQRLLESIYQQNDFLKQFQIREIFDLAPPGIVFLDTQGCVRVYNSTFLKNFLKDQKLEHGTLFIDLIDPDHRGSFVQTLQSFLASEKTVQTVEFKFLATSETPVIAYMGSLNYKKREGESQSMRGAALYIFDNSEQEQIQLHLMQSKKLQAMGQLAGGIAHDFNNLLTAMIGFCDLILLRHSPGDQSFTDIMQIKQNANRAANLVRQLLAFSRQQTLQPKVLDIIDALANLTFLLQRLVGPSVKLKMLYGRDLGLVKVDQGQFEQVIINLVVNARDAMKEQGEITIKTSNKVIKFPYHLGHEIIAPGAYVLIDVMDTGHGISREYLPKIFDPFFSTKEMGSGTGLGLSTVYGIVKQTGGHVIVESEPEKGSKFSIYLPKYQGKEFISDPDRENVQTEIRDLTGQGTILLVEDEDAVRLFSTRALRDKGYHVIETNCGEEALLFIKSLKEQGDEKLDLLITDVVMPQMDGPMLVKKAHEMLPDLKVIYMSGYAEDSFRRQLDQEQNIHFLAKPFSLKRLAVKVKETLDQRETLDQETDLKMQDKFIA